MAWLLLPLGIEHVISSPLRRAIQSTAPFCARAGLRVELEPRLVERVLTARDLPDWREHLRRSFDDLDYRVDDGESSRAAQERGTAVLRAALASGRRCVLVTHGNLLALILRSVDASAGFAFWSRLSNPRRVRHSRGRPGAKRVQPYLATWRASFELPLRRPQVPDGETRRARARVAVVHSNGPRPLQPEWRDEHEGSGR